MASNLLRYLKRAGAVTGSSIKLTRHSELSVFLDWFKGKRIVFGIDRGFQKFGRAVHEGWLLNRYKIRLTPKEKLMRDVMIDTLNRHPVAMKLKAKAICEKRKRGVVNGVRIGFTPDIRQQWCVTISDLKTTVCATLEEFIEKAFGYGYWRQGVTYITPTGCKHYFIIGIQKVTRSPKVYIVYINDHKDKMRYAEKELEFLLYFYKFYGRPTYT